MQYLKINALLLELWDDFLPESVPALLKENNLNGDWQLLRFEALTSEDKIRALTIRLNETERQLNQWRDSALKMRQSRNRIPATVLRKFGSGYRLVTQ